MRICLLQNIVLSALLGIVAGCAKTTDMPVITDIPIGFDNPVTRASVSSLGAAGDKFAVWGECTNGGETKELFRGEVVTCDGNAWSYDNIKYWLDGAGYVFNAVYPYDVQGVTPDDNGYLDIVNFDASESRDLMLARNTVSYSVQEGAKTVELSFRHLLSKVVFIGKKDAALGDIPLTVTSVKFYGMPKIGSYKGSNESWSLLDASVTDSSGPFASGNGNVAIPVEGVSLLGDILIHPQTVRGDSFKIEISYMVGDGGGTGAVSEYTHTVTLAPTVATIPQWEEAESYRYTLTLSGDDYILFGVPEVIPWNSASGGFITIS
ncbi:MAG TPA: fimbrillin family protein [Candidatus Avirikenella pullistercoris]|nr:fimbrillin family protein [Candidatus Avirikenella pullistercoris]